MNFADRIIEAVKEKNSRVCVGLDPRWERIPASIRKDALSRMGHRPEAAAGAIVEFNRIIIEAVRDKAVAVKPQIAFYELYRRAGIRAFWKTVSMASERGLPVIADVKRGDIGTTAEAYARTYLPGQSSGGESLPCEISPAAGENRAAGADAVTVNPYLGRDALKPFLDRCRDGKGIFVLVRTSNPSAGELQSLPLNDDEKGAGKSDLCREVARLTADLGGDLRGKHGYSAAGAVVAVTGREEISSLRRIMKNNLFLCPGYGAQGGGADDVVPAFNDDGLGAIVTSSRGINYAREKDHFSDDPGRAARQAAEKMRTEINQALTGAGKDV